LPGSLSCLILIAGMLQRSTLFGICNAKIGGSFWPL
jgi:hypothetical protein